MIKIFQQFLAQVIFGDEELSLEMIEIDKRDENSKGFKAVKVTLSEAIEECFQQIVISNESRRPNPLWSVLYTLTGKCYAFNGIQRTADANSRKVREMIARYVRKRVSGEKKSALGNKSDLLSLFLDSPEIFTEEFIIDELVDFLVAGTQTTQYVT